MSRNLYRHAAVAGVLAATIAMPSLALAEQKIGSTLEEIIELAKQEPTVTLATTWEGEIIDYEQSKFKVRTAVKN